MGFMQFVAPTISFLIGVMEGEPLGPLGLASFGFIWAGVAVFSLDLWNALGRLASQQPRQVAQGPAGFQREQPFGDRPQPLDQPQARPAHGPDHRRVGGEGAVEQVGRGRQRQGVEPPPAGVAVEHGVAAPSPRPPRRASMISSARAATSFRPRFSPWPAIGWMPWAASPIRASALGGESPWLLCRPSG